MEKILSLHKPFNFNNRFLKYWAVFKANYFTNTAYPADLLAMGLTVMLRTWIFYQLYGIVFLDQGVKTLGGYSLAMTVWSLALAQSFINSSRIRLVIRTISEDVQAGNIAYNIARPYSYIWFNIGMAFGRIAANLVPAVGLSALACIILVGPITMSWQGLAAGVFLLFCGLLMITLQCLAIGLLAFWAEDTSSFERIYQKASLIFGGIIVPLNFFPEGLRKVGELLPFSQAFYPPSRILVNFEWELFVRLFLVQLFWVVLSGILAVWLFKKGVKNVSINGG